MSMSRLDQLYRSLLLTKFFTHGWGKPENLKRLFAFRKILSNRETCQHLVSANYPIYIDKEYKDGDCRILEGHFMSPFVDHLPGIMPKEVETASFQAIIPLQWRHPALKPVCIHLAGTGDHYFWRRRMFTARPLLKEAGIASIILENPYYGTRKPKEQLRSSLHNVSDLFVMGGALVLESLALLHWCERQGWGPLGLSGISMGGHMASLAATNWTRPISLTPCLSWSTASCVFTQGVMSGSIPWDTLQEQFFENSIYQDEIRKLLISPEDNRKAYDMGQQFAKNYSSNIEKVETIHKKSETKTPSFQPASTNTISMATNISKNSHNMAIAKDTIDLNILSPKMPDFDNQQTTQGHVTPLSKDEYIAHLDFKSDIPPESKNNVPLHSAQSFTQSGSVDSLLTASSNVTLASVSTSHLPAPSTSISSVVQDIKIEKKLNPVKVPSTSQSRNQNLTPVSVEPKSLSYKLAVSKSRLTNLRSSSPSPDQMKNLQQEALDFMRGVMDECTHLGNFSVPVDPELIIIVSARQDAYVPKEGVLGLDDLWPGCEVRYVDNGHVGAVLLHQSAFRKAIADAFDRQVEKYYQNPGNQPSDHTDNVKSIKAVS
ncbi:protein ABHD18-like isoform X1 [Physella acuta]|uniref:protein ABHD18-like isoform X1 n=1 Tax=Physella acuta TaxID=109671 RepID=UPI0027DB8547|nr:protein ABHD18-like isoform X1 [Physella acuta]XP_059153122.1 protein ABHD18-like isoform X1 [Physella acuta]XP_059153123.1 protein ABHD18-like isoform X1 [Physella acuta]